MVKSPKTILSIALATLPLALPARAERAASQAATDQLSAIETRATPQGGRVVVRGDHAPVFSVFRLTSPDRIVLDLAGADTSRLAGIPQPAIPGLHKISAVQFQRGDTRVGRVVLEADASLPYDVKVEGTDVDVLLGAHGPATAEKSAEASAPAEAADPHLLERALDRASQPGRAHRILSATAVSSNPLSLAIHADGALGDVAVLRLKEPGRVALDFAGLSAHGAHANGARKLAGIRFGEVDGTARVVFDLGDREPPRLTLHRSGSVLTLAEAPAQSPAEAPAAPAVASAAPVQRPVAMPALPAPRAPAPAAFELRDLRVTGGGAVQEIVLDVAAGAQLDQPKALENNGFELQLHGVNVPERLRRTLDASAFAGPISTVSSFNVSRGEGRVVVAAAAGTAQEVVREGNAVTWRFARRIASGSVSSEANAQVAADVATSDATGKVAAEAGEADSTTAPQIDQSSGRVAGFTASAADAATALPKRTRYTGRRISLEFKDIDIQNLLRLFADISHKNVVVSDDVKGKVTIALRNVPWDQAFDLILKTHGLGKEESGNIVRVAPIAELEKERKEALDALKAKALLEPLRIRLIPVNYALAGEVADKIKDVLSDRGVVTVDARTNVLIVKDISENLAKAEGMVRNLDTQTPQVLIEARIVEAATNYAREMGIQWGGNASASSNNGNATGLVFPSTVSATGAAGGGPNTGTADNPNYAVNLPAAIGQGAGGGLGFIFGSAGGAFNLNLRLSALENNGVVKTVSAPKVATLDNQEADISQGVSIPFAQVSAAGVQTAFIEARLELKVTPHVTSDGSVLLKISATNNQPNAGITGSNGQPSISRKEAKTQMLVRDGDTSVIGGIYTRAVGVSTNQVPFFGSIPILGWLFKHRADSDNRTELLIFITPRILNRQQIVAAGN